ncbi:MAG: aspartate aminotransferase family protein [Lentisphaerae bacterium]|jgi:putrescine---pyruvate transaminase|nr:aspartate aminotransferase family protein [Lentisphaerota bacterium]MBT4818673.1 aspartate aminotransferase family protein [Lentisphaerota bacterium]MBT5610880.1 aspartate aminotransferase family protein [Lentisphaerota bacterium]MBT7060647.1 aspartate aminotransferase family protein [Lentisphaerota bacterium]MBT7846728.1 aspartate aminotransferase family protein [Lentisphaerota bacterium]
MPEEHWTKERKAQLHDDALRYVIPHFASNEELAKGAKIFTRGKGCYVYDLDGKEYLDTFATLLTTVSGHCRPEVTAAVTNQMETLEFFPNYVDTFTVPLIDLARKLAELMPGDLEVSFFVNSGSEANETALKMARQYHVERGERHRYKFVGRRDSYHATTLGGSAVTGLTWFREYFEPLMPGAVFAPAARDRDRPEGMTSADYGKQCLAELEDVIVYEGPETIAGMIMDPIPGSNTGYPLPPEGYIQGVRELCDKHGIVLIFDEVQTGFGKTGRWFACELWDTVPDIMTVGKGFTGGFIPLAAAVTTPRIADVFRNGPGTELRSGSTYGGHTVACAATLENIRILERDGLVQNAARMGAYLKQRLEQMRTQHRIIGEISGIGLLLAIRLEADPESGQPFPTECGVGSWIREWCYRNGMILRNNGDILVLAPSLIVSESEADVIIRGMDQAITAAEEEFGQ